MRELGIIGGKGMVVGVGTDIIEIDRIAELVDKENFRRKYFSARENEYFDSRKNMYEKVAGNYAAKEAFSKALGTGIRNFALREVEILRDELGKPYIELSGDAKKAAQSKWIKRFHVSISHCKTFATATVIAEK